MHTSTLLAAAFATFTSLGLSDAYTLKEDFFDNGPQGFFDHFDFFTGADPTHGLVHYVDHDTAFNDKLIGESTDGGVWMGVDHWTTLSGNQGRDSVRISSKNSYTHMLVVVNVTRMPVACGGWPAFWTLGSDWPSHGEIDIIEGVHKGPTNQMTLHTSAGCSASGASNGLTSPLTSDCIGNTGCGFASSSPDTYSSANDIGGGVWAMEWTSSGISVWWWDPEDLGSSNVLTNSPDPNTFGKPQMNVPNGDNCDIDQHFSGHSLIFDWTFCGDWAGNQDVWAASGCKSDQYPTCASFVQGNPGAYSGLGWDVKHLKVFQQ